MKLLILLWISWGWLMGCANPFSDFNPTHSSSHTPQDVLDELVCHTVDQMEECYSITGWFVSTRSSWCFATLFIGLTSHYEDVTSKWDISEEEVQQKMQELQERGDHIKTQLQDTCNQIEEGKERRKCKIDTVRQIKQNLLGCS